MKKTFLLLLLTPTLLFAQPHKKKIAENPKLSLNRIFTTSDFSSVGAGQFYMLPDGGYARQGAENIIYKYQFGVDKAVDSILYPAKIRGFPAKFSMEEFVISASGNLFLLKGNSEHIYRHSNRAEYYLYDKSSNKIHKVFEAGSIPRLDDGRIFYATISPDEKNIAFVYRNNLYMEAVDGGNLTQITRDGEMNKIINGKSDWVYEEEFVVVQAFEWSPKGDKIAFYRFDESKVKEYTLTKYDSLYPTQYTYKYPVSGEDNSEVSIWIYDINSKGNKKLDVGEKKDQYIPRIKWTRDNNLLSIQRMNRMQNHLELLIADASSGSIKKLYDEENKTYIDITDNLYFMPDNSFIMSSGKEGFNQFYYYDAGGKLIRKLTPYEADINDIITMDEKTRTLYYHTQKGSPMDRYVYKVNLDSGVPRMIMPKVRKVAGQDKGQFNIQYSSDFKYYVFSYSSSKLPLHVELYNSEDKLIKIYADNAKALANAKEVGWVEKEFIK
ncbi:MAG: DPP IV N-terminal domain-containing protein, partial [Bacteroidetes bacterium]|nr:DPP IV N-terminal domain-containing protein [Bacteroidota bacterium]